MRARCRPISGSSNSSSWPGRWLHVPFAQQHYISANYTHAASYLLARGLNVVTQLVAKRVVDGVARYSLSCNTDTTLDILRARAEGRASFKLIGQVNSELPFMPGPGDLPAERIQRDPRQSRDRISAVRAAIRADHRHQICHRPSRRGSGARRRHAADRDRAGRRCAGAGLDRPPSRQRAVPRDHAAARAGGGPRRRWRPDRSKRAFTASAKCCSRRFSA